MAQERSRQTKNCSLNYRNWFYLGKMEITAIVSWVLGAINIILGFALTAIYSEYKLLRQRDEDLHNRISATRDLLLSRYVTIEHQDRQVALLQKRFDRLELKLDTLIGVPHRRADD